MARKRGGLAGMWDRNKKVIKAVAPMAAAFIPGVNAAMAPWIGASLGAAMGGLDRPGKRGIGLDVKGAALGGLSGYAGGKMGESAQGGLSKLFTGAASSGVAPAAGASASPAMLNPITGAPKVAMTSGGPSSYGAIGSYQPTLGGAGNISVPGKRFSLESLGGLFGKEGKIEQNKTLLTGLGKGIMGVRSEDIAQQAADEAAAENKRQFSETMQQRESEFGRNYGLDAAEEERKQKEAERIRANRAKYRAMFTGGAVA
jgi:hypothetical protein